MTTVEQYLQGPPEAADQGGAVDVAGYLLAAMPAEGLDVESTIARAVRARGDEAIGGGADALVAQASAALASVLGALERESGSRYLRVLGGIQITLDDYLATRVVELVVHADDLATSVDVAVDVPPPALELATDVLVEIARRRRGDLTVLRGLARRERIGDLPLAF
jgi:hypothetical protein